jgi:hypothetical protein
LVRPVRVDPYTWKALDWGGRWPCEEVWKRGRGSSLPAVIGSWEGKVITRSRSLCVATTFAALALAPAAAHAATATSDGTTIRVTSPPGESIVIEVGLLARNDGKLPIDTTDGTVTAGAGCTPSDQKDATCNYTGTPNVIVDLGDGNDTLIVENFVPMTVEASGGPGNDRLNADDRRAPMYAVPTVLDGGPGDDSITTGRGPDVVRGGDGVDSVSYLQIKTPTTITLNGVADDGSPGEGDNVASDFEQVFGSDKAPNTIVGDDQAQELYGGVANDVLDGAGGNDVASGYLGDDTLIGGPGDDKLGGGADSGRGDPGNDRLDGGPGADQLFAGVGNDTLLANDGTSDPYVDCEEGDDTATVDAPFDQRVYDCEHVQQVWTGPPKLDPGAGSVTVRRGRLRVPVTCFAVAGGQCRGKVALRTLKCLRVGRHCRKVVIGRARVNVSAGSRRTLVMRVSRRTRSALRRHKRVRSVLDVTLTGAARSRLPIFVRGG